MKMSLPRRLLAGSLIAMAAAGMAAAPLAGAPPVLLPFDISGTWKGSAKTMGVSGNVTLRLQQDGQVVTGTVAVKHSFGQDCKTVSGIINDGTTFSSGLFHLIMETPHVNPFTCGVGQFTDVSEVDMLLTSNVKMTGSFEHLVPELPEGNQIVTVVLSLTKVSGMMTETDPDGPGPAVPLGSPELGVHDMAVTKITAPKTITLSANKPSVDALVKVEIQNRGQHSEVIADDAMLGELVTLTCTPLGTLQSGTPPVPVLHAGKPQKTLPLTLKPKQKLVVVYDVTVNGAFDPEKTKGQQFHGDYSWSALVDHAAIDGQADQHVDDDECPRNAAAPYDFDHYPDGTIKDKGAGSKLPDKTLGGQVFTDVVVK